MLEDKVHDWQTCCKIMRDRCLEVDVCAQCNLASFAQRARVSFHAEGEEIHRSHLCYQWWGGLSGARGSLLREVHFITHPELDTSKRKGEVSGTMLSVPQEQELAAGGFLPHCVMNSLFGHGGCGEGSGERLASASSLRRGNNIADSV